MHYTRIKCIVLLFYYRWFLSVEILPILLEIIHCTVQMSMGHILLVTPFVFCGVQRDILRMLLFSIRGEGKFRGNYD